MTGNQVFNATKTLAQYEEKQPLFFGPKVGLFDTVNKHYPEIWKIYKTMKSLDWSEDEFDYTQCNLDFKNCPKPVYEMMIRTLAWQWEADSVASKSIAPLLAPFITDSSLWAAWQRVSDNEVVHAATYSEIVRMSFDNPEEVLKEVLAVKESFARLDTIKDVFDNLHKKSHEYALLDNPPLPTENSEYYDAMFLGVCALLMLERIQFMGSFDITFTICSANWFQPVGKAVQKIAQDELEVHVDLDKTVLKIELATEHGRATYKRLKPQIEKMFREIVNAEMVWTDYLFSEGRELVGTNASLVKQWVLFNAKDVATFLDLQDHEFKFPKNNPQPHMEEWLNIGKNQGAPQEADNNQYKVNTISRDDASVQFEVDF